MKKHLWDYLYDSLVEAESAILFGKEEVAREKLKEMRDTIADYRVMHYLDALHIDDVRMINTGTEYGYINIEKNGKKGEIIL